MQLTSAPRSGGHHRIRTCIATKRPQPESTLLRVVAQGENPVIVVPDPKRKLGGRGAWITPTLDALDIAEQRKAFGRALRVSGNLDTGPVRAYVSALHAGPATEEERH
ncbi:YlxR family protein [Corynebacterium epidermidicanis]|uniref:Putative nucleic-acid-binding protein implicated in transcription termination n=1 Tax=Corynebacterium epidermidicanis TaxID=1050174 RepID=A0A0G3GQ87_9CORY|nr:YlxR family protein [Corynebacterium epidermidicanis]AKK03376.1 putative nucleic-acid-binding protein implicated in transcription termination [Corynebacterium epidermidicanis]